MQASPASTDKPLPRQIIRRSAAIQATLDARRAEPKDPAAPTDPQAPTPGSPAAATPADPNPGDPPALPADPRENDPAYWKQRFKVSEGRFNALKRDTDVTIDGLTQRVSELTEQVNTLQANAPQPPTDLGEFLTPEQVELLGEDEARTVVDTVLKAARKEVAAIVEREIKPLQAKAAKSDQETFEEQKRKFVERLTQLIPDFEEIDADPAWLTWLTEVDPATGLERNHVLQTHIRALNAQGAALFFNAWKASKPKPPAPPVAPNGSGAGGGGSPLPQASAASGFRPTSGEIQAFYKRKATLRKGQPGYVTDQEALEFEKRLKLPPRRQ